MARLSIWYREAGIPIIVLTGSIDAGATPCLPTASGYVVKDSLVGGDYVARLVNRLGTQRRRTGVGRRRFARVPRLSVQLAAPARLRDLERP